MLWVCTAWPELQPACACNTFSEHTCADTSGWQSQPVCDAGSLQDWKRKTMQRLTHGQVMYNTSWLAPPTMIPLPLTSGPGIHGRISGWLWQRVSCASTSCVPASSGLSSGCGCKRHAACLHAVSLGTQPAQPGKISWFSRTGIYLDPIAKS